MAEANRQLCVPGEHNYQPRYNEEPIDQFWNRSVMKKTWVADVCSKCGDTIAKPKR